MSPARDEDTTPGLTIAAVLYEGMTALDAVGPLEVLRFLPGARVELVATAVGPVRTDVPAMTLAATTSFAELRDPDVVIVPGGPGTANALDGELVAWLREVHPTTRWTTSVCSGSLVLAAAGLLHGAEATSHFSVVDVLGGFGALPCSRRVVTNRSRHVITSAGVSSGIDMALVLAADLADELTARAIQLVIEYDPQPPYRSGALTTATAEVVGRAIELGRPHGAIPDFWAPPAADDAQTRAAAS